jgi:hypothetical protein
LIRSRRFVQAVVPAIMPIPFPFPLPIPLPLIRAEVWSFDQAGLLIDGAYDQALIGSSKGASIGA